MDVTLPEDLRERAGQEFAGGRYQVRNEPIAQTARHFLEDSNRGQGQLDALRRIGQAVDKADLYERVLVPGRDNQEGGLHGDA